MDRNSFVFLFGAASQMIFDYIIFKLLIGKNNFQKKEIILLLVGSLIIGNLFFYMGSFTIVMMILFLLFLGMLFVDFKKIYIAGAMSYALIISVICDHISGVLDAYLWKNDNVEVSFWSALIHLFFGLGLSLIMSLLIVKLRTLVHKKIPFMNEFAPIISIIGIYMMVIYYISILLGKYLGNNTEIITLNLIFFIIYFFISVLTFFMYASSTRNKYEAQQKELEYLANQRYMESMENQFKEISKFRHDYKNILMSMENFIVEKDIEGLNDYYHSVVKTSSQVIEQNNYKLEKLGNIQVRELKSILASKLITAQEKGINTKVEVTEIVDKVNMDSVALVRVLGIFLDNAIEELEYLGSGLLSVALYQDEKAVHVILQNSCREDIPKFHKLKTRGFSTKGTNRGNGLSNVQEIIAEADNLFLSTSIVDDLFTQKLVIEF
ncbi:two-component system, LytTR family, sensor histidine kinase AgrC [Enterococcus sp. DIV0212c]